MRSSQQSLSGPMELENTVERNTAAGTSAVAQSDRRLRRMHMQVYRFGDFALVPQLGEVRFRGRHFAMAPKVFAFVRHLVENRDRVVTHADLHATLWPGITVSEASLTYTVMAARRALGDSGSVQGIIRNVRSRGYRFVAAVDDELL